MFNQVVLLKAFDDIFKEKSESYRLLKIHTSRFDVHYGDVLILLQTFNVLQVQSPKRLRTRCSIAINSIGVSVVVGSWRCVRCQYCARPKPLTFKTGRKHAS